MKISGIVLLSALCLLFSECLKDDTPRTTLQIKRMLLADKGIWYVNAFQVNGEDSLTTVYSIDEEHVEDRKLIFKKEHEDDDKFYGMYASDVVNYFDIKSGNSINIMISDVDCGCNSFRMCIRNVFSPERVVVNKLIWDISSISKKEVVFEAKFKKNYKIVLNRNANSTLKQNH